jgi:hypothetical protein
LKARVQLLQTWAGPLPAAGCLPRHYRLEVASTRTVCDVCEGRLHRQRTSLHYPVGILLGQPRVHYVEKQCVHCGKVYRPEDYHELVPSHGKYALDLMVEVGMARFRDHRQNEEIQRQLDTRWSLEVPPSTINGLAHTFLDCLAATHWARAPQLRKRLEEDGGYVLHGDGTCEAGTDTVFNAVAGNRGWTLAGAKMAGEEAKPIAALFCRCVEFFGMPLALVRDLSPQIEAAGKEALGDTPDLVCHYHFLDNVGTKLCEKPHARLTAALRRLKIQPALRSLRKDLVRYGKQKAALSAAQIDEFLQSPRLLNDVDLVRARRMVTYAVLRWLEDYGADLQGEYFPFDLPSLAFYRRGCQLYDALVHLTRAVDFPRQALPTLATVARHLAPLREEAELAAAAERLEKAEALFLELRNVLRLTSDPRGRVLHRRLRAVAPAVAEEMVKCLDAWRERWGQRLAAERDADKIADLRVVLEYLEKYRNNLVGHVIPRPGRAEPFVAERTNNISEHRFATTKQGLRRKVGTKKLARSIQAMRPEELLVANLDDPEYLQILCGGKLENLAAVFAENWKAAQAIRAERRKQTTNHPIPIRKKTLRDQAIFPRLVRAVGQLIEMVSGGRRAA